MSDTENVWNIPLALPREAFSPRDAARAGDLWRTFQEAAVQGSAAVGWPPDRYWAIGSAFIVREMRTVHHRETGYGEPIEATTWLSDFRRGLLVTRQIDLSGREGALASTTQEWAHVSRAMRPGRAPQDLVDAFVVVPGRRPSVALPAVDAAPGQAHRFAFRCWHTWMDPLGHANHPIYVDWCDEALSVAMARAGLDPLALAPVAERVRWKKGVTAGQEVVITSRRTGRTASGAVAFDHVVASPEGVVFATATTIRRLVDGGDEALAHL